MIALTPNKPNVVEYLPEEGKKRKRVSIKWMNDSTEQTFNLLLNKLFGFFRQYKHEIRKMSNKVNTKLSYASLTCC